MNQGTHQLQSTFFIARVQLEGDLDEEYEDLHEAMREIGFFRSLQVDGESGWKVLPKGEYCRHAYALDSVVREDVQRVASNIQARACVMVVAARWASFENLREAAAAVLEVEGRL